jgi:copper chaperone CopZ
MVGIVLLSAGVVPGVTATGTQLDEPGIDTITLKIDGWTCASCAKDIRKALVGVPGVKRADVSYSRGGAVVEVEAGHVTGEQLVQAVASAGNALSSYRATVVPNGALPPEDEGGGLGAWLRKLLP